MTRREHHFRSVETEDGYRVTEPGNDIEGRGGTIWAAFRDYIDQAERASRQQVVADGGNDA